MNEFSDLIFKDQNVVNFEITKLKSSEPPRGGTEKYRPNGLLVSDVYLANTF